MSALPAIYLDAKARNVTPFCPSRDRLGLGFDIPGQEPVRLALTLESARFIQTYLESYIKEFAGTQRPMSALISSESKSVSSDGENV